jgi:hypothetical protein
VETTTAANPFVELANQLTAQAVAVHAVLLRQIEAMSPSDPDDREEFDVLRKQFVEYQTEIQSLVGSQAGVIESDRALRGGAASRLIRPLPSPWPQRQPKNRCGVSVCPHRRFRLQCFRSGSYLSWRAPSYARKEQFNVVCRNRSSGKRPISGGGFSDVRRVLRMSLDGARVREER